MNHSPAKEGQINAGTGMSADNYNTLERTSAHEFGHTLLGQGHDWPAGNLMLQSVNANAGMKPSVQANTNLGTPCYVT